MKPLSIPLPNRPGFCFSPTEEELLLFYLPRWRSGARNIKEVELFGEKNIETLFQIGDGSKDCCFYVFSDLKKPQQGKNFERKSGSSGFWYIRSLTRVKDGVGDVIGFDRELFLHDDLNKNTKKSGHWRMHEYSFVDERGNSLNNEQEISLNRKIVCFIKYSASSTSSSSSSSSSSWDSSKKKTRLPRPSNPRKETSWPGFHFIPTEEELVGYYLSQRKLFPGNLPVQFIRVVDVYAEDPWTLFNIRDESQKYCFYVFTVVRDNQAKKISRKAGSGSWNRLNTTGVIDYEQRLIGVRAHYNFITEKEKKKKKKKKSESKSTRDDDNESKMEEEHGRWTMHEYRAAEESKEGHRLKSVDGKAVCVICCNMLISIKHSIFNYQ